MKAVLCVLVALFALATSQYCDPCQQFVATVEAYVSENTTETQIIKDLETLCALLPSTYKAQCDQALEKNLPQIIQSILNLETPKVVCTQLSLCNSARLSLHRPKKVGSQTCTPCETVVALVERYVNLQGLNPKQISLALEHYVCPALQIPSAQCLDYAAKVSNMIDLLQHHDQPADICNKLSLCPSAFQVKTKGGPLCSACLYAVSNVKYFLSRNETIAQIQSQAAELCVFLPNGSLQATCNEIVANDIPAIIQEVAELRTPRQICVDFRVCTNSTVPSPRLKVHP